MSEKLKREAQLQYDEIKVLVKNYQYQFVPPIRDPDAQNEDQ